MAGPFSCWRRDHLRLIPLAPEIYRVSGRSSIGGGCTGGWRVFWGQKSSGHESSWESFSDFWYRITCRSMIFPDPLWDTRQIHDTCITTLHSNLVLLFLSCQLCFVSLLSHLFLTHYCMCKIRLSSWSTKLSKFLQISCELHPWNTCIYIDIVPRPRPTVHFLGIFRYLQRFSGILPTPSPDFLVHHAKIPGRKPPTSIHAWLSISP